MTPHDAAPKPPPSSQATPSPHADSGPPSASPAGGEERASQHGKRAILVAAVLGSLVVGGLLVDSLRTATKPAPAAPPEAKRIAPPQDPFIDFEVKQRLEAARLETERRQKMAQDKAHQESRTQEGAFAVSAERSGEQEVREAARLDDLKHSLAAVRSHDMLVSSPRAQASAARDAPAGPSAARGASRSAAVAEPANAAEPTLARLRQAIDRLQDGGASEDGQRFTRDLRGQEAAAAVVGQTATARRERGAAQRPGEYLIPVGTVMSAILDIEISSDWEGRWRAMITRDVYDLAQDVILIPKGTRVLGTSARPKAVNEAINRRMALVAQWLVLPNGARIDLTRSSMLDVGGVGAISGDVNHHFLATLGGVAAYGVIGGLGAATAAKRSGSEGDTGSPFSGRSAGAEIALGMAEIGKRVASRYLNLVPTITVKPGTPMAIFLDDEMFLQAWAPIDEFAPAVAARVEGAR